MRIRLHGRLAALLIGSLVAFQWSLTAQTPTAAKQPLTYEVVDSWRSIQGTRLSNDGQWLSYALTSPGDDGELVVRNLRTNQEFRHPRGTAPTFTPDGKFLVFTIVPTKAEDEKVALETPPAEAAAGANPPATGTGRAGRGNQAARALPRNSLGIMALPAGQVTTVEKVGSFRVPDESSTWLAYYKGNGGAGGGGRGGRGGAGAGRGAGGGGRQGAPPAAAASEAPQGRGQNGTGAKWRTGCSRSADSCGGRIAV